MTHEEKGTAMDAVLQPVFERGFDGIREEWETGKIYLSTEGMPA